MKVEGLREDDKEDTKAEKMNNNQNKTNKNFLLISLEEKETKKIAEAINNSTGRRILDALAIKEYTETELSKELDIPISTVHYNLKQLMEANLVIVDEFHYSPKGKEVNHYKLANKYIIIAPKSDNNRFRDALNKILPLTIITAVTGGLLTAWNLFGNASSSKVASVQEAVPRAMMTTSTSAAASSPQAIAITRPFLQSEFVAWFFVGALSIIVIYFVYELVRKK